MKINLTIILLTLSSLLFSQFNEFQIKEYNDNGSLDALIKNHEEPMFLVQIDAINDSLLNRIISELPDLEFYAGPSSYHRLLHEKDFLLLEETITEDFYKIIEENYEFPETRNYWALTLQGSQYNNTSGETSNSCMCLDSSDCVVVGYNDSWYNPFDYYGEASWSFSPPPYDEILEIRLYVSGVQCDDLPLWSETDLSIKENDCSWSDFQVTLSEGYTTNGPYVITDDLVNQLWCDGTLQPIIGSEDNYNVDWVQVEIYYTCDNAMPPQNFEASNNEFCDYVSLNWSNDTNLQGYNLYRDGEFILSLNSNENEHIDYFANENIQHEYCLAGLNGCGESEYNCVLGSKRSGPNPTESIFASDDFINYILISWEAVDDSEYYNLYRNGSMLSVIPSQATLTYEDTFVNHEEIYEYCIESVNECGESDYNCDIGSLAIGFLGDINLDETIDVLDIVLLLNFVLELNTPTENQFWLSDINQDQILNILDIVALVSLILEEQ